MNKLIYNYKAFVEPSANGLTVDGKTFDALRDKGYYEYVRQRFQLWNVDLPDTNQDRSPGNVAKFMRARQCLTLALLGPRALEEEPLPPDFHGRSCILAPMQPNRYLRAVTKCYLQVARNNILYQPLSFTVAGFNFLDVNKFMYYVGGLSFEVDRARDILDSFEIMDVALGGSG